MDQPLNPELIRKKKIRQFGIGGTSLLVFIFICFKIISWIRPSIEGSRIRTAIVERGNIEASVTASGVVAPEYEQVISSSIETRLLKVIKHAGDPVKKGEQILLLDTREAQSQYDKLTDQIALKANNQKKLSLELKSTLSNLDNDIKVKSLELELNQAKLVQQKILFEKLIASKNDLQLSELEEARAKAALEKLQESKGNSEELAKVQIEGLNLEMRILQKEQLAAKQSLEIASTKSEIDGIVTWTPLQEGISLRKGEMISRIADLRTFQVIAKVSDVHATKLFIGLPAKIVSNADILSGEIINILPTVENGIITVYIGLKDKSNSSLRSNLRVDVQLITDFKQNILRVKKGPFANGTGYNDVFVINGDDAKKIKANFGAQSFDYFEVLDGLNLGDKIIISNTESFKDYSSVKIQ